jgi:hypothetical protein
VNGNNSGFSNPVFGGNTLIRPAMRSPNYVAGVSGWSINRAGDAEFNDLTLRGEFVGTDYIINSAGIFLYSAAPALGNLVGSWTPAAGTDAFGNAYDVGLTLYSPGQGTINLSIDPGGAMLAEWLDAVGGSQVGIAAGGGSAGISFAPPTSGGATWQTGGINAIVSNVFGTNTAELAISGPYNNAHSSHPTISMFGSSDTSSSNRIDLTTQQTNVSGLLAVGGTDVGQGIQSQVSINANVSGLTTTETVLMTIPSMTFTNGRAYRVTLWGLAQSTTASTYFLYKLRKGSASTSGTVYKDQMRVPVLGTASTNSAVSLTVLLVNNSGADITTAVTWTGSCAAGTGIFAASAGNLATATIEDVGLASAWPGQPIS